MYTTDQTGLSFAIASTPRRIVSLVPSQTELLYTLGMEDEVVGITRFCIHPEEWRRTKKRVGGTKDADVERIRSLHPDIVFANREENRRETVSEIGCFCPVWTSDVSDIPSAMEMIRSLGVLLGRANEADTLVQRLSPLSSMRQDPCNLRAAYLIWKDPWMTVGGDTFIQDMMRCAGLNNVFGDRTRYPETGIDEIASLRPDVLLLSSEPYPFRERHAVELRAALPAVETILVDGEMFSWYGSRMLQAMDYMGRLRERLHASRKA